MSTEQQDQFLESCSQRIEEALTTVRFLKDTQRATTKRTLEVVNKDLLSLSQAEALRQMGSYMLSLRLSNPDETIRKNRHEFYDEIMSYLVADGEMSNCAIWTGLNLIVKGRYAGRSRELTQMLCFVASAFVYAEYVKQQHSEPAVISLDDVEPTEEQLQDLAAVDAANAELSQEAASANQEDSISE